MNRTATALVSATAVLALAACSSDDPAPSAGDSPAPSSSTAASSPTDTGSADPSEPSKPGEMTLEEAGQIVEPVTTTLDESLALLYAEIAKPEPSLRTVRRLARRAVEACDGLREVVVTTDWPAEIREDMTLYSAQLKLLSNQYEKMTTAKRIKGAVDVTHVIEKRFDTAVVVRLAEALDIA